MHHTGTSKLWISLGSGIVFFILGVFASLFAFGLELDAVQFLPGFLYSALVTKIMLIIAGLILLYDSFSMRDSWGRIRVVPIIVGLLLAFIGAFPLMLDYGLLTGLPFIVNLAIPDFVLTLLLAFYGLYLIVSFFKLYLIYKMQGTL